MFIPKIIAQHFGINKPAQFLQPRIDRLPSDLGAVCDPFQVRKKELIIRLVFDLDHVRRHRQRRQDKAVVVKAQVRRLGHGDGPGG